MSEANQTPQGAPRKPGRASLLGKGWAILRGDSTPPESYFANQPEMRDEAEAPLLAEAGTPASVPTTLPEQASPEPAVLELPAAPEYSKLHRPETPTPIPHTRRSANGEAVVRPATSFEYEAMPPIEGVLKGTPPVQVTYEARDAVRSLTPELPEDLDADYIEPVILDVQPEEFEALEVAAALLELEEVPTGPVETSPRPDSGDLFSGEKSTTPDDDLLDRFVTDERLDVLWAEIETLQNELAESTGGNRQRFDTYQKELLQAYSLLLENRANYDDVRAIVYRIKGETVQDRQIARDIQKYKPRLLLYFVVMLVVWGILMLLEPVFAGFVVGALGLDALGLVYHPTLFGMLGALVNGYFNLNKHTVQERNFDPTHLSWYVMNPLIGAIMGLLMTLVFGTGIVSTIGISVFEQTQTAVVGQYPFLLWVLCFLAGYNQNVVLRLLSRTFNMLRGEDDDDSGVLPEGDAEL